MRRSSAAAASNAYPAHLERRRGRRFPYPAVVRVDNQSGAGIDISTGGISVLLAEPVPVGHVVVVALGRGDDVSSNARVVRLAPTQHGFIVALQFVE